MLIDLKTTIPLLLSPMILTAPLCSRELVSFPKSKSASLSENVSRPEKCKL